MSGKAEQEWAGLNARQRLYLSTIFDFDQQAEADIKRRSAKWMATPPASEWRQITYDIKLPKEIAGYSSVQSVLRRQGEHDTGSGSTLAALRRRGLVSVIHDQVVVMPFGAVDRIRVRLTTTGRAAARHGAGITAPASPPQGLMARWSLLALTRLYAAGERGLCNETTRDRADAAPSWNTLLHLRDRRDGSLIEEFVADRPDQDRHLLRQHRVRCSPLGRHHFAVHRACYAELYPDVDLPAVDPADTIEHPHAGPADHRRPRPRHLVRDTDLRLLLELDHLAETGRCYLRQVVTEEFQGWDDEVPGWVGEIPNGLLRWQVKDLTRSDKSTKRLAEHASGPLVEQVEVCAGLRQWQAGTTTPMVVITDHGRAHLREHRDAYQHAYPELFGPTGA
ncbi:hypothetical protein [Crossiella sp. CA198]|uniref:hypothetical protein n=1 Tax=Crossiella sp. CA198 TaxID=3455607 RepID=UPI003F8D2EFF